MQLVGAPHRIAWKGTDTGTSGFFDRMGRGTPNPAGDREWAINDLICPNFPKYRIFTTFTEEKIPLVLTGLNHCSRKVFRFKTSNQVCFGLTPFVELSSQIIFRNNNDQLQNGTKNIERPGHSPLSGKVEWVNRFHDRLYRVEFWRGFIKNG